MCHQSMRARALARLHSTLLCVHTADLHRCTGAILHYASLRSEPILAGRTKAIKFLLKFQTKNAAHESRYIILELANAVSILFGRNVISDTRETISKRIMMRTRILGVNWIEWSRKRKLWIEESIIRWMNGCVRAQGMRKRLLNDLAMACSVQAFRAHTKQCIRIQLMEKWRVHHCLFLFLSFFALHSLADHLVVLSQAKPEEESHTSSFKQAICAYEIITVQFAPFFFFLQFFVRPNSLYGIFPFIGCVAIDWIECFVWLRTAWSTVHLCTLRTWRMFFKRTIYGRIKTAKEHSLGCLSWWTPRQFDGPILTDVWVRSIRRTDSNLIKFRDWLVGRVNELKPPKKRMKKWARAWLLYGILFPFTFLLVCFDGDSSSL